MTVDTHGAQAGENSRGSKECYAGLLVALRQNLAGLACRTDHWERNCSCYMAALDSPGILPCSCTSVTSQLHSLVKVKPNQDLVQSLKRLGKARGSSQCSSPMR